MKYRITAVDDNGKYFPWVYRAHRASDSRLLTFGENPQVCFENEHNCKLIYYGSAVYGSAVLALEFNNESDAVMFKLKWI